MSDPLEPDQVPGAVRTLDRAPLAVAQVGGLDVVLEAFLASALDSPHSRRAYGRHVRAAFRFWGVATLAEIAGGHLAAFRAHVLEGGAVASQAQSLAAVRAFLLWASHLGGLPQLSPDQVRQLLKGPRGKASGLLSILSPDEARRLVDAAGTPRDRALALVLLGGGLRAAEASALEGQDLCHDADGEPLLRIHGKGRKERLVPIHGLVAAAIHAYLLATGRRVGAPGPVFLPQDRGAKRRGPRPLSTRSLQRLVDTLAHSAGIAKAISPHCLRHTYATHVLKKGGNLVGLAKLLGHASVATTQRYADHLELSELRELVPSLGL